MSTCWKCEKELPDGQVECEYGCGNDAHNPQPCLIIQIAIKPNDKITKQELEAFHLALVVFRQLLLESIETSGLNKFCKPI